MNAKANKNNPVVKKIVTEKHTEAKSKSIIRGNRRVINTDDDQKNIFQCGLEQKIPYNLPLI